MRLECFWRFKLWLFGTCWSTCCGTCMRSQMRTSLKYLSFAIISSNLTCQVGESSLSSARAFRLDKRTWVKRNFRSGGLRFNLCNLRNWSDTDTVATADFSFTFNCDDWFLNYCQWLWWCFWWRFWLHLLLIRPVFRLLNLACWLQMTIHVVEKVLDMVKDVLYE